MKDKWKCLKENDYYKKREEMQDRIEYFYHDKNEKEEVIGSIVVFHNPKYSTSWSLEQWDDEKSITYRKIEATPKWFQELYNKAEKKRSEMTRLRKLFEKKEETTTVSATSSMGLSQTNVENDINDIFADFFTDDE